MAKLVYNIYCSIIKYNKCNIIPEEETDSDFFLQINKRHKFYNNKNRFIEAFNDILS